MELKIESMKNMKKVVEKCLDELMKKNDLTPAETKAAIDGLHLYDELCCRIEDCEKEESEVQAAYSERSYRGGYSGCGDPYREYHITSYGMPERAIYSDRGSGQMSRGGSRSYSGKPNYGVTGWYQNNYSGYPMEHMEQRYYGDEYSDRSRGYSRHSISDRLISEAEKMMDSTESEYERQELHKYIRMIRRMADAE